MGGNVKTLTCPLGQNQLPKSRWGEKCEDPHTPLGWNQLLKVDGGRNVQTLTQLLKVDGGEM